MYCVIFETKLRGSLWFSIHHEKCTVSAFENTSFWLKIFETHFKEYTLVHFVTDNRKIYIAIQGTIDVNNSTKNLFSSALMIKRDELNPISS